MKSDVVRRADKVIEMTMLFAAVQESVDGSTSRN
jgi:hypothetical protein